MVASQYNSYIHHEYQPPVYTIYLTEIVQSFLFPLLPVRLSPVIHLPKHDEPFGHYQSLWNNKLWRFLELRIHTTNAEVTRKTFASSVVSKRSFPQQDIWQIISLCSRQSTGGLPSSGAYLVFEAIHSSYSINYVCYHPWDRDKPSMSSNNSFARKISSPLPSIYVSVYLSISRLGPLMSTVHCQHQ